MAPARLSPPSWNSVYGGASAPPAVLSLASQPKTDL